ncbi:MAG: GGDEF domain-containing protein [Leptospiraceae bacterium]|nr:MAG: GGDEF domain-containing protein [Leptospiraceae bacterium]
MQIDPKLLEIKEDIKILIVEDSKLSREYTNQILKKYYNTIYTAENGIEGIEIFKTYLPDIVITDIRMPEMDGLTMLKEMKKINNNFYSIVLSAHDEKDILKTSILHGVTRFITKPIKIEELVKTIESIKKNILFTKKLNLQNQLIENILNSLDIIVAISDGNELYALNQYGLNLIGYSSIEEFRKEHKCICEFFINEPGFIQNTDNWLSKLETLEEEKRKILIYDVKLKQNRIFFVNAKPFLEDPQKKIVSFYDITLQEKQKEELKKLATIDFLTGIYNRHHFHTILQFQFEKQIRYPQLKPFAILMMDLDHFKEINDKHGHLIGDEVLKEFAHLVKNNIRKSDFFARWGGEEFIILVPETNREKALQLGEKIRSLVENHFKNNYKLPKVTVSIGISIYSSNDTIHSLIERADQALYMAKRNGRNRVEIL